MHTMTIGTRTIGPSYPCFVIAEVSANHRQHIGEAIRIIEAAADAGADAVKMQTYTPDTITIDSDKEWFQVGGEKNPDSWKGKTLYNLYQTTYAPWEWNAELKKRAEALGLIFFSSPFDETAVDALESIHVPCYKIASYEATDFTLLRKIAKTGKPVIMSVGFASQPEIEFAVDTLRTHGAHEIALLHCVTAYADAPEVDHMNLRTIADVRERFQVISGFSDNNGGIEIPVLAVAAGASIVEKHVTIDRAVDSADARFSLEPQELKQMIRDIRRVEQALGVPHYGPVNEAEQYNKRLRRSLFATQNIKQGELFTPQNVRSIRPAFGLETRYINDVLGKHATQDIERGTPLAWSLVEGSSP